MLSKLNKQKTIRKSYTKIFFSNQRLGQMGVVIDEHFILSNHAKKEN